MWEKEIELIETLGKLYPEFEAVAGYAIEYKCYQGDNYSKARWVFWLCTGYLKQRLPRLEHFIRKNNRETWSDYKIYFEIWLRRYNFKEKN